MAFDFLAGLFQDRQQNQENATGSKSPLLALPEDVPLSLDQCRDIYTYWGLGKRLVHALPRFSMSAPREINIQEAPPEAVKVFQTTSENLKQDDMVSRSSVFCRIYGMSGLFTAYSKKKLKNLEKPENMTTTDWQKLLSIEKEQDNERRGIKNLTIKDVQEGKISFNAVNPLNLAGTIINQDALSTEFMKPERICIAGETVGSRRATIIQNNDPIYLRFNNATFTFSGVSIFQNMVRLVKAWHLGIISLERMAIKGGSIVWKDAPRGKMTGTIANAARASLQRMKELENNGAVSIDANGDVTFFPLTGVQEVDTILKGLEREITMALDDTPLAILLDKSLSSGLSEGTEDLKAVIMAVNNFRKDFLKPLYALTDPYVMAVAWTDEFIIKMVKKYPNKYLGYTTSQVRQLWQESFTYEFGNLYPPTEKEVEETNKIVLENIKIVSDMGGEVADIQAEITERKIFKNEITINPPVKTEFPELGSEEDEENGEEQESSESTDKEK